MRRRRGDDVAMRKRKGRLATKVGTGIYCGYILNILDVQSIRGCGMCDFDDVDYMFI